MSSTQFIIVLWMQIFLCPYARLIQEAFRRESSYFEKEHALHVQVGSILQCGFNFGLYTGDLYI